MRKSEGFTNGCKGFSAKDKLRRTGSKASGNYCVKPLALAASYDLYPEKFHALWEDAVARQKDRTVLWNIGFRGQGDRPFWDDDVRYQSDEARGALMGELIKRQYDIVKRANPEAVCCTNLYGETIDLYKKGCLKLPADVIKIWADNGYGKMVSRRQGNENPRVCALPENKEEANGIYYHVSFYDLQAANHMTMLPNTPEFVKRELTEVIARGGDDFWIINCSNVKPHVYYLDFIAQLWKTGTIDIEAHRLDYVRTYYGAEGSGQIAQCLKEYAHDRRVMLIMNMENHLKDDELFALMEAKLD